VSAAADDCFAQPELAALTIELATNNHAGSSGMDDRIHAKALVKVRGVVGRTCADNSKGGSGRSAAVAH
jgi:hypothetical protein